MTERDIDRRDMLQALGGTATLVGLAGCLGGGGGDGSSDGGDGGDGSSGDGGDGGSGDGSSDGGDGSSDGGSGDGESGDGESEDGGEEQPEEVPVVTGTVYEFDGETKVSQGRLTLIDNLGNQVTTHDLAVSAEFRLTGLKIDGEYELQITQMESYPDQTVEFVAEPPEGYGESEDGESGDGGGDENSEEEEEDPDVPLTMAVDDPETSIVDPETNSITMETGVTGTESYAWEGRLEFQTDRIAGQWTHKGERSANKNAVVTDENLAQTKEREKESLRRVFIYEENEESGRVLTLTLVNPIQTGTTCREENDVGGYPDWVAHQAVQNGLEPFDSFTYNGTLTFDEHPAKLGGIRVKEYEVDPEGTPLTFTLYAHDSTGEVVRVDGDFDTSEIDQRIFESQLLSTRGVIDFFEHGEDRFVGVNAC